MKWLRETLFDFRENFNVTTGATCKISEFLMDIIQIDQKIFSRPLKKYLIKNSCSENHFLDFETKVVLPSENPFYQACSVWGGKVLRNYFKAQTILKLEPV